MRFDIHFRSDVAEKMKGVVTEIRDWNIGDTAAKDEIASLSDRIVCFRHCAAPDRPFLIAGADGSGDFPCVRYGDSVVYLVTAMSRLYEADTGPMSELPVTAEDVVEFLWLPEDKKKARTQFLTAFSALMDTSPEEVCRGSDYYEYAKQSGKGVSSPADLLDTLILPGAHDSANIGIQLYSTAEVGALVRLMKSMDTSRFPGRPVYVLEDTTLALPMVAAGRTLFFEIAKRYACEYARNRGFFYMALSKSHNMPCMDLIEDEIRKRNPTLVFPRPVPKPRGRKAGVSRDTNDSSGRRSFLSVSASSYNTAYAPGYEFEILAAVHRVRG